LCVLTVEQKTSEEHEQESYCCVNG